MKGEALKGHLDLLILASVRDRPLHGYAVAEALRINSRGVFDIPEGTLYPALHRLEKSGRLASRWSTEDGRRRRIYEVTALGKKALAEGRQDWKVFSRAVTTLLADS